MMRLLYTFFVQPILNIFSAWWSIFRGDFRSLNKMTNDHYYANGYQSDYENIAHDWQQIGGDMKRAIIKYNKTEK